MNRSALCTRYWKRVATSGFVFLVLSALPGAGCATNAAENGPRGPYRVGLQVLDFSYPHDGINDTLTVAVWYPTSSQQRPYNYGGKTNGFVAVGGAPLTTKGRCAFLAFSHGLGGSGYGSAFFQEELASFGWVVAAPDHHDPHSLVRIHKDPSFHPAVRAFLADADKVTHSGPESRSPYLYRVHELQLTTKDVLATEPFRTLIDANRIVVGGHSMGGFSALGLCGTIPKYRDPRIKALLLFSTGAGGYLYTDDELARVKVPSVLLFGQKEEDQKRNDKTMNELEHKIFQLLASPKYLLEIRGADHFSFDNALTNGIGAWFMSGNQDEFSLINKYAIAFLEYHVAGHKAAGAVLTQSDPRLALFLRQ
jgi:predicted dienelactone hydrolase